MPYIKPTDRSDIDNGKPPQTAGELNYVFTAFADLYLQEKGLNYQNINDVIGALEGAKLELYRRIAVPYEDKKRAENGDVYTVETGH